MIKIAFAGKGGVGKSTIASLFIKSLEKDGMRVLAVDCDPVATLGRFLGIKDADKITPIVEMKELINERTEASKDRAFYKLNPRVDDIPERFSRKAGNVKLIVMGSPSRGGSGCMCPEASFMKALLGKLLLQEDESVVLDMEAGLEHLGRGTAAFVEHLFIVTEPNLNSIDAAKKIRKLADDLKIKGASVIANKVRKDKDLNFIKENITDIPVAGSISFDEKLLEPDTDIEKTAAYKQVAAIEGKFLSTQT